MGSASTCSGPYTSRLLLYMCTQSSGPTRRVASCLRIFCSCNAAFIAFLMGGSIGSRSWGDYVEGSLPRKENESINSWWDGRENRKEKVHDRCKPFQL